MTETLHRSQDNAGTEPRASANVRHLSRMELPGGGQVVIQGQYAFVGHQHRPDGTTILDVSDPRKPKIVSKLMTSHPLSHSHKVRVVDAIMGGWSAPSCWPIPSSSRARSGFRTIRSAAFISMTSKTRPTPS